MENQSFIEQFEQRAVADVQRLLCVHFKFADFFEGFEFLVCSITCNECVVARFECCGVLDNMYTYIYIYIYIHKRDVAKKHETIVEGHRLL